MTTTPGRLLLHATGLAALVAFSITKCPAALQASTRDAYRFGDLYQRAKVRSFRPAAPLRTAWRDLEHPLPERPAPAFLFGDSFSVAELDAHPSFRRSLERASGGPLAFVETRLHPGYANPLQLLVDRPDVVGRPAVVVLERVERNLVRSLTEPLPVSPPRTPAEKGGFVSTVFRETFTDTEARHELLLQNGAATFPLAEAWSTLLYRLGGRISPQTPRYSTSPPFLFLDEEADPKASGSFFAVHDDALVERIAGTVAGLASGLRARCGAELVFVPVPNKLTLHSRLVTDQPYDEFLPRLCSALERRGVRAVDLVARFRRERDLLYFPTDTHWNGRGIEVAVEEVLRRWPGRDVSPEGPLPAPAPAP